ncbi:MAG TPA: glucoamylase family protein [Candidatus Acidoferrales bacterium]|nr:glucoamylase family protein [Candidatus Acidoferrales bacterium]
MSAGAPRFASRSRPAPAAAWAAGLALAVLTLLAPGRALARVPEAARDTLLDALERRTFQWFWDVTPPSTGLVPDRWPAKSFSSVAAIGFGLAADAIGAERGWVTRGEARGRVQAALEFLWDTPQGPEPRGRAGFRGFFYHFLDPGTAERFQTVELSTIDTALLMAGVLFVQSYFDRTDPAETEIRALADSLYRRVDWTYFCTDTRGLTMSWRPEPDRLFSPARWTGLDESIVLHVLALGSPTHAAPPAIWAHYTSGYRWAEFEGESFYQFAPLFGHQYSQSWIDFRGLADDSTAARGIDYFENARRAARAQRRYAIDDPAGWKDYGADVWGLTACDGPTDTTAELLGRMRRLHSYWARGAAAADVRDDGTIAPTAAASSIAYAPAAVESTLAALVGRYGEHVFNRYGFVDAFNPSLPDSFPVHSGSVVPGLGWFDHDQLGIDQGPILLMIENERSGLVWRTLQRNPYVVQGLCRAGFHGGWLDGRCR